MDIPVIEETVVEATEQKLGPPSPSVYSVPGWEIPYRGIAYFVLPTLGAVLFGILSASGQPSIKVTGLGQFGFIALNFVGLLCLFGSAYQTYNYVLLNKSYSVFWMLFAFLALYLIWSLAIFQPDINKGLATICSFIMLAIGLMIMAISFSTDTYNLLVLPAFAWLVYTCYISIKIEKTV